MQQVTVDEASVPLRALIDAAFAGEEILITKEGGSRVQLVPRKETRSKRQSGSARGLITMAADFDAPLEAEIE